MEKGVWCSIICTLKKKKKKQPNCSSSKKALDWTLFYSLFNITLHMWSKLYNIYITTSVTLYALGISWVGRKSNAEVLKARTTLIVNTRKKWEKMRGKNTAVKWNLPSMALPDETRILRKWENDIKAQYTVREHFKHLCLWFPISWCFINKILREKLSHRKIWTPLFAFVWRKTNSFFCMNTSGKWLIGMCNGNFTASVLCLHS